jgi:hypothetical protein
MPLLHHVGQLMGQQTPSRRGFGRILTAVEDYFLTRSEGTGVYRLRGPGGALIGVDPDVAEVMA